MAGLSFGLGDPYMVLAATWLNRGPWFSEPSVVCYLGTPRQSFMGTPDYLGTRKGALFDGPAAWEGKDLSSLEAMERRSGTSVEITALSRVTAAIIMVK